MAIDPVSTDITIRITTYPLTNLIISTYDNYYNEEYDTETMVGWQRITDTGSSYEKQVGLYFGYTQDDITLTISADGYKDYVISIPQSDSSKYSQGSLKTVVLEKDVPDHLYGWTDSNASDIILYAWDAQYANSPSVLYTKDAVPTSSSKYYDANGNEIQLSSITYSGGWVATALKSGSSGTIAFDCMRSKV